ncbi:cell wall glycoprotein [Fusarium mundagurra]|uniref:Cell wall glycoprotein n=1 Tax=Fusarium mundagurra TaxID=1567541 RepID=A0A8H5YGZ7_9HYPO|nr:cell wall glycoprotein [Fusarium mundagurra]
MVSNTRSVFVGLMLSAAQLSSASPAAASDTAFSSPIYPTATDSIPALPSSTDECLAKCNAAHDKCNTAPGANHATCAAEYAECLGYNPYGSGSLVAPTACSHSAKPTATETAKAGDCLEKCNKAHDACNEAPDANHATCAAEWADCLGYNPYDGPGGSLVEPTACSHSAKPTATETVKAGDCLEKCNKAHDACNEAPNANHATCAAEWADCLGYNPYDGPGGSLVEPTACAHSGKPTGTHSATATASAHAGDCLEKCNKAHDACNEAPNANHATCAAEWADCLGYNPYDGPGGSLVEPTACAAHTTMASATGTGTSKPAKSSEPAVVVNGAGSLSGKVAGLVGAIGAAVALL